MTALAAAAVVAAAPLFAGCGVPGGSAIAPTSDGSGAAISTAVETPTETVVAPPTAPRTATSTDDEPRSAALSGRLSGRTFLSTAVHGRDLAPGSRITLSFGEDGGVSVSAGCNHMGGAPHWDHDVLALPEMFTTEMGCEQPLMDQDRWFADLLASGLTVSLTGNRLTLAAGDVRIELLDRTKADLDRPFAGTTRTLDGITASRLTVSSIGPTEGHGLVFRAVPDGFTSPDLIGHTYRLTRLFTDDGGADTKDDGARFDISFTATGATARSQCGAISYPTVRYQAAGGSPVMVDLGEPEGPACSLGSDPSGVPRGRLIAGFSEGDSTCLPVSSAGTSSERSSGRRGRRAGPRHGLRRRHHGRHVCGAGPAARMVAASLPLQRISHPGACGKTPVTRQNRCPRVEDGERRRSRGMGATHGAECFPAT